MTLPSQSAIFAKDTRSLINKEKLVTAKILPIFEDPGFFGGCRIGADEAPADIIGEELRSCGYYAVLIKDSGRIEADDFLSYARRFAVLCFQVYKRATWELRGDIDNTFNFLPRTEDEPPSFTAYSGISALNYRVYKEMFDSMYSMGLCIRQRPMCRCQTPSEALIEWSCKRPETIFLSADGGMPDNPRTSDGRLEKLLLRKMFFVSGTPPNHRFSVNLGLENYNDEMLQL